MDIETNAPREPNSSYVGVFSESSTAGQTRGSFGQGNFRHGNMPVPARRGVRMSHRRERRAAEGILVLLIALAAFWAGLAHAVDEEVRYVTIQPTFVTNFGYSESARLKYLKADVALRVSSQEAEMALRYHFPALRNSLVLLFSRQDQATVSSGDGREALRQEAMQELRAIMEQEEGNGYIEDLVFSNFIVQH